METNEAIKTLKDHKICFEHDFGWNRTVLEALDFAIQSLAAADVVPVRHGRWIEQPLDFELCGVAYYQCSECGKEQQTPSNYCQFCGALMDRKIAEPTKEET